MESAVTAVLGGPKPSKGARAGVLGELAGQLAAVASSPDGRLFALSTTGQLAEWTTDLRYGQARVGRSGGLHAGPGGVVVSWGDGVFSWRNGEPTKVTPAKADGALVRDDGSIVWWEKGALHFPKSKVARGLPGQVVSRSGEHLVAASEKGVRVFELASGELVKEFPLSAPRHAVSDDLRIATWRFAADFRTVTVSSLRDGSELRVLTVDKGHIDRVVFAGDQLLVRYHAKKRVAVFDAAGKSRRIASPEASRRGLLRDQHGAEPQTLRPRGGLSINLRRVV